MRLFLVTLLCLLAIGCKSNPRVSRQTALLRAEILDLEDKYYLLKAKHEGLVSQIGEGEIVGQPYYEGDVFYEDELLDENGLLNPGIAYGETVTDPANSNIVTPGNAPSNPSANSGVRSIVQPPEQMGEVYDSPIPQPDANTEPLPVPDSKSGQPKLMLNAPGMHGSSDIEISFPRVVREAAEVTEIEINQTTTLGRDVDGILGDEGIDLLVQPKTATGQVELQAGELTISVIDEAARPERQRIGTWKFLPDETKLFFANDESGNRGILLHLPWDQSTPVNEKLVLHVRFVTFDGRVLQTSGKLRIEPPTPGYSAKDPKVAAWTRQDRRWIPDSAPMRNSPGSNWRQRSTLPDVQMSADRTSGIPQVERRLVPAIPAKGATQRPAWRPVR